MRLKNLALALTAGLLIAGPAVAQRGGPGGGFGPGGFGGFGGGLANMLGQNKQLQEELKIDKDQVEKLNKALAKVREDLKDEMDKLRDFNTSPEDRAEVMKKLNDANAKAVNSVLKPEQQKRLHQIENQQAGLGMFAKDDVRKALKLTEKQQEKIKDISADYQKDMRELFQGGGFRGGFDPESRKKMQTLQKEAIGHVTKLLDDKQKETLKDLTGKPFELTMQGFGPGGGGPGGGRGGPGGGFGGGFGGFAQPGQVLAPFIQDNLKLTDEQKKKLKELQKQVDEKLDKILTDEQKKQLKEMRQGLRGGGPGGRGGRGGRGGPDGPPPDDR
jgi:Spy/CpxP family protein refolding chaperone